MKKIANGQVVDMTAEEIAELQSRPIPPQPFMDLNPALFKTMLSVLGISIEQIQAAIDQAIANPLVATYAKNKVAGSTSYSRANPLFDQLAPLLGKTPANIDAAWRQAEELAEAAGF